MSRVIFVLLVMVGVVFSIIESIQQQQCGLNQEWSTCSSPCPQECNKEPPEVCPMYCVTGCKCKEGYLLNASGQCVLSQNC